METCFRVAAIKVLAASILHPAAGYDDVWTATHTRSHWCLTTDLSHMAKSIILLVLWGGVGGEEAFSALTG